MAEVRDFLIAINIDQRGAQDYSTEMEKGANRVKDIADQINRTIIRGMRIAAGGKGMSERMRREAERRRRDAERTIAAMRVIGEGMQKAVVKEIGDDLKRPSASSGALKAITASDRNASFRTADNRVAIGIGNFEYLLTNKKVPYALAIEGGTEKHVGRAIVGLWFASTGRPTGFGAPTKTQSFVAMRAAEAAKILVAAGRKNFRVAGVIHTAILPHEDYKKAVETYDPRRRTLDAIRRIYGSGG